MLEDLYGKIVSLFSLSDICRRKEKGPQSVSISALCQRIIMQLRRKAYGEYDC